MKNNKLLIVVLVLVLIGYFIFNRAKPQSTEETPVDATQGKININVVCEGALAYMTFEDGASADKFVAECKEGKYPEVIEQYKKQLNLGEGAEI